MAHRRTARWGMPVPEGIHKEDRSRDRVVQAGQGSKGREAVEGSEDVDQAAVDGLVVAAEGTGGAEAGRVVEPGL